MTDQVAATAEAQPIADANFIDSIVDNATIEAPKEAQEAEPSEPEAADAKPDDAFPKKAVNALSRRDKQIGKLRAQLDQERFAREQLEQRFKPQQTNNNTGEPKETDFQNYHDYMRAVQKFDLGQEMAKLNSAHKETQQTAQEQAWISQREQVVATSAQSFIKENPDAQTVIEEYADLADEFPPQIQRLFLEADNAPLAFYNLAKEGKLEELSNMSLAKAAMEIGRAQTQAPIKPKTKAPTPLPASRGSVASGKQLDDMSGEEIRKWMRQSQ